MHRSTLDLLRCPRCHAGSLVPEEPVAEPALIFGPVRCLGCTSRFPVHEGLVDLVVERGRRSLAQQALEWPWVARSWERYVRPAVSVLLTFGPLDRESEYAVMHSFAGKPNGPVVDLGCGSGGNTRRLVRDFEPAAVIGVDASRPMVDEAMAQLREHGLSADFVRAEVPPLPFADHSVGVVLAAGVIHFVAQLEPLLAEVARVLKPQGRFVASTFDSRSAAKGVHRAAGVYPRTDQGLQQSATAAGFVRYEQVRIGPTLVWKAELP